MFPTQSNLGCRTFWFSIWFSTKLFMGGKMSLLSNTFGSQFSTQQQNYVSLRRQTKEIRFLKNLFSNSFWNKPSWRTEVPVCSALKSEQRSGGSDQARRWSHRQGCLFCAVKYLNHRTLQLHGCFSGMVKTWKKDLEDLFLGIIIFPEFMAITMLS